MNKNVEKYKESKIHRNWELKYGLGENELFFNLAFDYITSIMNASYNTSVLDAGCGYCTKSILLAKRGFLVTGVDISDSTLNEAKEIIKLKGFQNRIEIIKENITSLSFKDNSYKYILCWGVLMHIPKIKNALNELARVLKPGGILVISENNMNSVFQIFFRLFRTHKPNTHFLKTPAGIEHWFIKNDGSSLVREANIGWLIKTLKKKDIILIERIAGQFTELYVSMPFPLFKKIIHSFNNFWFKYIKIPNPAIGNILIFKKKE